MSSTIVQCVPNFSNGRDKAVVDAIIEAMKVPGVYLLDREMDADHNRSVITLVGDRESIGEAAIRGVGKAAELIDLNHHQGAHPRMGAADVIPFIPIEGVSLEDCVVIARQVGAPGAQHDLVVCCLSRRGRRQIRGLDQRELEGLGRNRLAFVLDQLRLVIEEVEMAWSAGHEQVDHALGFGRKVRRPGRHRVDRLMQ